MPPLPRPHWEKAAVARANGAQASVAYANAGFKPNSSAASEFFQKPAVMRRVAELMELAQERERETNRVAAQEAGVDKAWVTRHMKHAALMALRGHPTYASNGEHRRDTQGNLMYGKPQLDPAVKALAYLGRDLGMFIERHEVGDPGSFERMDDAELRRELIETATSLGIPAEALLALEDHSGDNGEDEE